MISYTVTTEQTTAQVVYSKTASYKGTTDARVAPTYNDPDFLQPYNDVIFLEGDSYGEKGGATTFVNKTFQNGRAENSYTETTSVSFIAEFTRSGTGGWKNNITYQTNGWKSFDEGREWSGEKGFPGDPAYSDSESTETQYEEETSNFTYTYKTTSEKTFEVLLSTTKTSEVQTTLVTTTGETSSISFTVIPTITTVTTGIETTQEKNLTFVDTYETVLPVHPDAPRATATVFCQGGFRGGQYSQPFSECVWIATATNLIGPGPWALTDIADSFTETTALPLFKSSPLKVIDESVATFPEVPDPLPEITETFTTSTQDGVSVQTVWTKGSDSEFPLQSLTRNAPKFTTTTQERTVANFTENNPALTEKITEIGTQSNASAAIKNAGLTYQEFYSHTYTTTRHAGTWSQTYTKNYNGPQVRDEDENGTSYYTNVTINSAEGVTISGTNVEQIKILAFTPCAVSHVETSFSEAWGLHGSDGPQPKSKIDAAVSFKLDSFAELLPGVSVPYPSSYSWASGNSSFTGSILGNVLSLTILTGTGSNASTESAAYEFSGQDSAYTEQLTGRDFFTTLREMPALTFFGPHAATESVETRARPGTYVQISQDSLGDYTLNPITLNESSSSTLSQNAILYAAEQSFYTSTGGDPFLIRPRNPIP